MSAIPPTGGPPPVGDRSGATDPLLGNFGPIVYYVMQQLEGASDETDKLYYASVLAKLTANPGFTAALKGSPDLTKLFSDTSWGASMSDLLKGVAAGGATAQADADQLVSKIGASGSPEQTFYTDADKTSYTPPKGDTALYNDVCMVEGRLAGWIGTLHDALNNGETNMAAGAANEIALMMAKLTTDAGANPNDAVSALLTSLLTTSLNGAAGDDLTTLCAGITKGTPTAAQLQTFYDAITGGGTPPGTDVQTLINNFASNASGWLNP